MIKCELFSHSYLRAKYDNCQSVGVEESMPRLASRQQHCQNIQAPNSSEYFRLNLTIPLLDHLINEISSRFNNTSSHTTAEF